jgi:oxalate decarboxylase/phosphoglucose isomerase-like protein (cupin superfamily)
MEGEGRMTIFCSENKARTFGYRSGDVGYVPFYIENTGSGPLRFLEMFRSDRYADVLLNQWLALTPRVLVEASPPRDWQRGDCNSLSREATDTADLNEPFAMTGTIAITAGFCSESFRGSRQ